MQSTNINLNANTVALEITNTTENITNQIPPAIDNADVLSLSLRTINIPNNGIFKSECLDIAEEEIAQLQSATIDSLEEKLFYIHFEFQNACFVLQGKAINIANLRI